MVTEVRGAAHLASAGVNLTVALAEWRSRKPVVVRQPLQRVARFSASSFSPNAFSGRPAPRRLRTDCQTHCRPEVYLHMALLTKDHDPLLGKRLG